MLSIALVGKYAIQLCCAYSCMQEDDDEDDDTESDDHDTDTSDDA